jgi:transcriptional regulator with XRE-family HTH domain
MSQRVLVVQELKKVLRERGITYAAVAKKLKLSEASIKRLFSGGDFTLERIDLICEMASLDLSDVLERVQRSASPINQLSAEQEREIVTDPKLFLMTWLVLNRYQYADIIKLYKLSEREVLRYLIKLDRLKIIELQPHNKVKLLVSRHFSWRAGGHVQQYIHQKLLREFFAAQFQLQQHVFFFHGGTISDTAISQLVSALQSTARECVDIMDQDRSVKSSHKKGAAFVLALRPWEYSGFSAFLREKGST